MKTINRRGVGFILATILFTFSSFIITYRFSHLRSLFNYLFLFAMLLFIVLFWPDKDDFNADVFAFAIVATLSLYGVTEYLLLSFWKRLFVASICWAFSLMFFSAMKSFVKRKREGLFGRAWFSPSPSLGAILVFIYSIFSLCLFWSQSFPYGKTPDTINQWDQIHGMVPFSDIHAIGHTILLKLLLMIYDNYVIVIVFHILLVSSLYFLVAKFFLIRNIPFPVVFSILGCFVTTIVPIEAYMSPIKDTPYSFCVGILTYYLFIIVNSDCLNKLKVPDYIAIGASIAGIILFRLNGIVVAGFIIVYLLIFLIRREKIKQIIAVILSFLCICAATNWYAYKILKAESPENGFGLQVFGSCIAAAVNDEPSEEELEMVSEVLPVEWMQSRFIEWDPKILIWAQDAETLSNPETSVFNNQFVIAMGNNKLETIRLFFKLLPNHFRAYLNNIRFSTVSIWGQSSECVFVFSNVSLLLLVASFCSSWWKGSARKQIKKNWVVFMPVLLNAISIAISSITNEIRYLMPTFMIVPALLLFIIWQAESYLMSAE